MEGLNKRLESILLEFLETPTPLTSTKLSALINVSARTIKKDITELNAFLKDKQAEIVSKAGVGYQISFQDESFREELLQAIKKPNVPSLQAVPKYRYERANYLVKKLLTVDYYIRMEDLIDELFVSRSTLSADLKEVREIFRDYGLVLVSRPNYGIILSGDEIAKRLCIAEYFFHSNASTGFYAVDNAMFVSDTNQNEINFVKELLEEITRKYAIHISDLSVQNFVIHILIAIRRWRFYNFVKIQDEAELHFSKKDKEYLAALELKESLEKRLNILLPEGEVIYFAQHIRSKHINTIDEITLENIELIEKTLYDIYSMLQKKFGYHQLNKQRYEQYIRLHIPAMIERLKSRLVMRNPMINDIMSKYLFSTHITIMISEIIEKNFQVRMNINELGYLILYTNLLFHKEKKKKNRILIVGGRGRPETITLINEIEESGSLDPDSIDFCDAAGIDSYDLEEYLLIASTVPLNKSYKIPVFQLESDRTYDEQILSAMKNVQAKQSKVIQYFSARYFGCGMVGGGREEVFKEVARQLACKELAAEFKSMERIVSHETTKGCVFFHSYHPLKENFIYIGILRKSMIWHKQWIQMIIYVNIENDLPLLKQCYDFLLEMINNPKFQANYARSESFDQFMQTIKEAGL